MQVCHWDPSRKDRFLTRAFTRPKQGLTAAVTPFRTSLRRESPAPDVRAWQQLQKASTVFWKASIMDSASAGPTLPSVVNMMATAKHIEGNHTCGIPLGGCKRVGPG